MEDKQTFGPIEDQALTEENLAKETSPSQQTGDADQAQAPKKKAAGKKGKKRKKKAKARRRRRIILFAVLGVLLALLVGVGVYVYRMLNQPQDLFTPSEANVTEVPEETRMEAAFDLSSFATPEATLALSIPGQESTPTAAPEAGAPATPVPSPDAQAEPTAVPEIRDNIVNIMLMGIDAYENGGTTSGTEPHPDAMMVIAVNFDKNTVDLITLPRDTFTTAPGLHGFYKLNGVFNAGGGMDDPESGFALSCRAAEIWLGGISIPYYYAVDFQAVVDIVDAIGGIDYDVDQPFMSYKIVGNRMDRTTGTYIDKGMHHLNGIDVLHYLRIRHSADGLDSSRTARQRRMMVAIFNKLKTEGKLSQIPALINAANSGIYTNTTLSQTTALASYAMSKVDAKSIRTRSVYGDIWYQHYFKYCFVDQQNRIDLIKEVYGIDAEPIGVNTPQYENWLYDIGFLSMKYVRQPEKVFRVIQEMKDQGQTFTDEQIAAYAACYQAYTALDEGFRACSEQLQKAYVDTSLTEQQTKALEAEVKARLEVLNKNVKDTTLALRDGCGIHLKLEWEVGVRWFVDQDINEVIVAFG